VYTTISTLSLIFLSGIWLVSGVGPTQHHDKHHVSVEILPDNWLGGYFLGAKIMQ
jgi:hypothetical protein